MFESITYNWRMHRLLRRLAKQRVSLVLQPGNTWVIEFAVEDTQELDVLLKTCFMRGWVEPLQSAVPRNCLNPDGSLPSRNMFRSSGPLWKLTDSGWAAIQRRHEVLVLGILVAVLGVAVAIV